MHLINASAISKVFNLASNIGAFFTFMMAGKVLYGIGIPIAAANVVGGYLGSLVAIRKGQNLIKGFVLAVFMILLSTLIFRMWKG